MITEAELGWMAGILDFQGHVTHKDNQMRARGSVQITVYVETTIREIIDRLGNMTGNTPDFREKKNRPAWNRKGCAEHCPEAHVHHLAEVEMPDIARWTISGGAAAVLLWNLRSHMITVHEPWDWAMAMCFASTRLTGQGSGQAMKAVRRLSDLGWELPPVMAEAVRDAEARTA